MNRKMTKLRVRDAVLYEQEMQYGQEINDPHMLSEISYNLSLPSRDEAYERGLNDARYAILLTKYSDFV